MDLCFGELRKEPRRRNVGVCIECYKIHCSTQLTLPHQALAPGLRVWHNETVVLLYTSSTKQQECSSEPRRQREGGRGARRPSDQYPIPWSTEQKPSLSLFFFFFTFVVEDGKVLTVQSEHLHSNSLLCKYLRLAFSE